MIGLFALMKILLNIQFADDIILFSNITDEAKGMHNELNGAGTRTGLQ